MQVPIRSNHMKLLSETSRQRKPTRQQQETFNNSMWYGSKQADSHVQHSSHQKKSVPSGHGATLPSPRSRLFHSFKESSYPTVLKTDWDDNKRLRMEKEQLSLKCNMLMNKLKEFVPDTDDSLYQLIDQTDARIQHLEENMKTKRDRIIGHYKVKTLNLLQKFGYKASQLNIQLIKTQFQLIELLIDKFTDKDLQLQSVWVSRQEQSEYYKAEHMRQQEEIHRLTRESKQLREQLNHSESQLNNAYGQLASMTKTINSRRIEETLKVEREKISFDRELFSNDVNRTKMNMKDMEVYFQEQCILLEKKNKDLEIRVSQLSKELIDERLKYSDACHRLDEIKTSVQQANMHIKMQREEKEKMHREALRWRDRFEQFEAGKNHGLQRIPPIEYTNRQKVTSVDKDKTITKTEALGLYDRRVVVPDDRTLGIFLDKEIKKLETDLHKRGLLTVPSKSSGNSVERVEEKNL